MRIRNIDDLIAQLDVPYVVIDQFHRRIKYRKKEYARQNEKEARLDVLEKLVYDTELFLMALKEALRKEGRPID